MYYALSELQRRIAHHIANLADMQPWDNRKFMHDVAADVDAMLATPALPEYFAASTVIATVRVADTAGVHPHRHVIVTRDRTQGFNVHTIAWDGDEWVGGHSKYMQPFDVAMRIMAERVAELGAPLTCPITGRVDCADRKCELHYMDAPVKLAPEGGTA